MIGKTEKCLNPWFGFLIILVVCVVISAAIFYEFRGTPGHRKVHLRTKPNQAAAQVAFPNPGIDVQSTGDKFAF